MRNTQQGSLRTAVCPPRSWQLSLPVLHPPPCVPGPPARTAAASPPPGGGLSSACSSHTRPSADLGAGHTYPGHFLLGRAGEGKEARPWPHPASSRWLSCSQPPAPTVLEHVRRHFLPGALGSWAGKHSARARTHLDAELEGAQRVSGLRARCWLSPQRHGGAAQAGE